jgi:hypothetical protein
MLTRRPASAHDWNPVFHLPRASNSRMRGRRGAVRGIEVGRQLRDLVAQTLQL